MRKRKITDLQGESQKNEMYIRRMRMGVIINNKRVFFLLLNNDILGGLLENFNQINQ